MQYLIEEKNNKKIGIFSDLHVGVSTDSKMRLAETEKCSDWIIQKFKDEKVDWVIFCGDLFNSRYSINVNSLNVGIEIIESLSYNFEKVFLIEGNHDTFYKNTNIVNSVTFLQKINDNITVVDTVPTFLKVKDVTIGLYPWGYNLEKVKEIEDYVTPTYGFGHFEMNGAELAGAVSSGSRYNMDDLFVLGETIFSGHYHKNKTYLSVDESKMLYMIGSPLWLDWGDFGQDKKIIVLNSATKMFKELKNNVNAQFKKVFYSDFVKGKYDEIGDLSKICKGNFVKFIIDEKYQFDLIMQYNDKIKVCEPLTIELDYLISLSNGVISESADEMVKANSKSNKDYLIEYIEKIFPEYKNINDAYDLDYLKELASVYYEKSLLSESERKEELLEE